jgi:hypothetical protein
VAVEIASDAMLGSSPSCYCRIGTGRIFVIYENRSNDQLYVKTSDDNGLTWSAATLLSTLEKMAGNEQVPGAIAADSSDNVHVIWAGKHDDYIYEEAYMYQLWYTKFNGTSWSEPLRICEDVASFLRVGEPNMSLAVDSNDWVHVCYLGITTTPAGLILYRYYEEGVGWGATETVASYTDDWTDASVPIMQVNHSDVPHVIFRDNGSGGHLYHTKRTGGSWSALEEIDDNAVTPYSFAILSNDDMIVTTATKYAIYTDSLSSWGSLTSFSGANISGATLYCDDTDNVFAFGFRDSGGNMFLYRFKYDASTQTWESPVTLFEYESGYYLYALARAQVINHNGGNIDLVYYARVSGTYSVNYLAASVNPTSVGCGRVGCLVHRVDIEEEIYDLEMTFGGIKHTVPSNPFRIGQQPQYSEQPPYPVDETFGDRLVYMYRSHFGNIVVTTNPITDNRWYTLIWVGYLRD